MNRDCEKIWPPWSRKEDGNLGYELLVDQANPGRFVFVERWASKDHTQSEHITRSRAGGVANIEKTEASYILDRVVV